MTSEHASLEELKKILLSREEYRPFPDYENRQGWESLPDYVKDFYLSDKIAEEILNYEIPNLTATAYMSDYRYGHTKEWTANMQSRRSMLIRAAIAECIEGKGRFLDKIIDILWATCEESVWISPRHNNHMHNFMRTGVMKNILPDVTDFNFIDLRSGHTAGEVSIIYYLLKKPLDAVSPLICKRVELEMMKRIVIPFMNHDDMTWNGFYGHKINNWNPWIVSNILTVGLFTVKDPDLRLEFVSRCMEKLDIYISQIPADGGCDEGPSYWDGAGGSLYDALEVLYSATDGKLNFMKEPSIRNLGEYIVKANVRGDEYVNFADNPHCVDHHDMLRLFRYGKTAGSELLVSFAQSHLNNPPTLPVASTTHIFCQMQDIFTVQEASKPAEKDFIPDDAFLPDTQILYVRDSKNALTAAAKGGFNNESHNHNDLGHFICSYEGEQILVDLGNLPYTPKTFSPFRYEIWILQSAYHNCAAINGFDQHDGDDYRAKFISQSLDDKKGTYAVELKDAYVQEAGVEGYVRAFAMDKVNSVWTVTDHVELKEESDKLDFHYISVCEPKLCGNTVEIKLNNGAVAKMEFDAAHYDFSMDTHDLDSDSLKKEWNAEIAYRMHLTPKKAAKVFDSFIKITVIK